MASTVVYILFAVAIGAAVLLSRRKRRRYPPGPPGLPLIGNFFDLPKESTWLTYQAWGQKYGLSYCLEAPLMMIIDVCGLQGLTYCI